MDSVTSLFIVYRYDSTTGVFTVPPGGNGFYYFTVYVTTYTSEDAILDLEINGQVLCSITADLDEVADGDGWGISCSGVAQVMEGKRLCIELYYI